MFSTDLLSKFYGLPDFALVMMIALFVLLVLGFLILTEFLSKNSDFFHDTKSTGYYPNSKT